MRCSFSAGGVTLHYTTLTTVWVDDVPIASNFHLYPPEESLPPAISDFLNFSSLSLDMFPNPVSWVSFVSPVPSRSILFDPAYSMLLDASSASRKSWMRRHLWVVIVTVVGESKGNKEFLLLASDAFVVGAVLFVILALVALVALRRNRVLLGLWQTTEKDEVPHYRKM
jgi:hypothetical protein